MTDLQEQIKAVVIGHAVGDAPGLPEDFECPVCGLGKDAFEKED